MWREWVAVVGELQRVEAENNRRRRFMTIAAVFDSRDRVTLAASRLDHIWHPRFGGQQGVRLIFGPDVGCEHPVLFRSLPDHARLDLAATPRKLFPEPRSHRKPPGIDIGDVDP